MVIITYFFRKVYIYFENKYNSSKTFLCLVTTLALTTDCSISEARILFFDTKATEIACTLTAISVV
jgi:hypothetical protein